MARSRRQNEEPMAGVGNGDQSGIVRSENPGETEASMKKAFIALLLAVSLLPGCAVMGRRQVDKGLKPEAIAQVQKGMSKEQVTSLLGAPQEIIFSNKAHDPLREHAYLYTHLKTKYTAIFLGLISFGNMDEKTDRIVVFFDDDEKVAHVGTTLIADKTAYGFPFGE